MFFKLCYKDSFAKNYLIPSKTGLSLQDKSIHWSLEI